MKEVIKKCEEKMTKTCENLDGEFANIRAGRANPNLLNKIFQFRNRESSRSIRGRRVC